MKLTQLVVFCILMENNAGLLDKSPDYLLEKYREVQLLDNPTISLDAGNAKKFDRYMIKWFCDKEA